MSECVSNAGSKREKNFDKSQDEILKQISKLFSDLNLDIKDIVIRVNNTDSMSIESVFKGIIFNNSEGFLSKKTYPDFGKPKIQGSPLNQNEEAFLSNLNYFIHHNELAKDKNVLQISKNIDDINLAFVSKARAININNSISVVLNNLQRSDKQEYDFARVINYLNKLYAKNNKLIKSTTAFLKKFDFKYIGSKIGYMGGKPEESDRYNKFEQLVVEEYYLINVTGPQNNPSRLAEIHNEMSRLGLSQDEQNRAREGGMTRAKNAIDGKIELDAQKRYEYDIGVGRPNGFSGAGDNGGHRR